MLQSMGLQSVGHDWATEQQQQWHETNSLKFISQCLSLSLFAIGSVLLENSD